MDTAPNVVLTLVSNSDQTELCEAYWREYGDWAVAEYAARYGVIAEPDHDGIHRELPTMLGDRGRLYLAELDGVVVATAALKPIDAESAEVKRMYVRPSARGRGLSRLLLERLLADAAEIGYSRLRLDTLDFMIEAQALYRSVGFVDGTPYELSETMRAGVSDHTVYMELSLTGYEDQR